MPVTRQGKSLHLSSTPHKALRLATREEFHASSLLKHGASENRSPAKRSVEAVERQRGQQQNSRQTDPRVPGRTLVSSGDRSAEEGQRKMTPPHTASRGVSIHTPSHHSRSDSAPGERRSGKARPKPCPARIRHSVLGATLRECDQARQQSDPDPKSAYREWRLRVRMRNRSERCRNIQPRSRSS